MIIQVQNGSVPGGTRGLRRALCLVALLAALPGCRRDEATSRSIPKEEPPPTPAAAADPHAAHAAHGAPVMPELKYETPSGWQELPASGMSLVRFQTPGSDGATGDVAVLALPGTAARDVDVINIFRQKWQLAPLDQAAVDGLGQTTPIGAASGKVYDLQVGAAPAGDAQSRLVVATLSDGQIGWYFRLTGPAPVVDAQKPNFLAFLKSIRFEQAASAAGVTAAATPTPAATPATATAAPPAAPPSAAPAGVSGWSVPEGWQPTSLTPMVLARFTSEGDGGKAEIAVSSFPGDVGGLVANVNRWRGQIGLPPVGEAEARDAAKPIEGAGTGVVLVDITGSKDGAPTRLIGAVVPQAGKTWFYKLTGTVAAAGRERDRLVQFVQSARYAHAQDTR